MKNNIITYSFIALTFTILLLSIDSYKIIPFAKPDGLDFQNIYTYSKCDLIEKVYNGNPYIPSGNECGDAFNRSLVYPPMLYYSMKWFSVFNEFKTALMVWRILAIAILVIAFLFWRSNLKPSLLDIIFFALLTLQFPSLFALERANNDVIIILCWTISSYFFSKNKIFISGFLAGSAVLLKLYPLFAFFTIILSLFLTKNFNRLTSFIKGAALIFLVSIILYYDISYAFLDRIKAFSKNVGGLDLLNHSIQYLTEFKLLNTLLFIGLIITWSLVYRFTPKDKKLYFAGLLSFTTYFSPTSFDYNLITIYPLLIMLFQRIRENRSKLEFMGFTVLVVGTLGNRSWFMWEDEKLGYIFHLSLQIIALYIIPLSFIPKEYLKNHFYYSWKTFKLKKGLT